MFSLLFPIATAQGGPPHIANWLTLLYRALGAEHPVSQFLHRYESLFFAGGIALFLCFVVRLAVRRWQDVPDGVQNLVELLVEGLTHFVVGIMGPAGRPFAPFIGTLFLYIWFMNLAGLVPGFKSPTADLNTTLGLALCVFFVFHGTAIRSFGFRGYLFHMMGQPQNLGMAVIGVLILLIESVGNFIIKWASLSMRLAFNITGEDTFLAVAVGFGPFGVGLQLMAMGLGLILGTAQALVFATLSAVFIGMMLPHDEEHAQTAVGH